MSDENKEDKLFKDISLDGKLLSEYTAMLECDGGNARLYISERENGFMAHAVEFVCCTPIDNLNHWENESLEVITIFEVTAYSDGVRHIEFNRNDGDMDGYLYYPDMDNLILMLQKIKELENELCEAD